MTQYFEVGTMPDETIPSNWTFQPFAEYLEQNKLQNHSSRVVYDDADEPIVPVDPPPVP